MGGDDVDPDAIEIYKNQVGSVKAKIETIDPNKGSMGFWGEIADVSEKILLNPGNERIATGDEIRLIVIKYLKEALDFSDKKAASSESEKNFGLYTYSEFNLKDYFEKRTWKEWRNSHTDTQDRINDGNALSAIAAMWKQFKEDVLPKFKNYAAKPDPNSNTTAKVGN